MSKTEKEIAFLRGLYIEPEWTQRFTDTFDESFKPKKVETFTYLNAGAGNHAIEIKEKLKKDSEIFPVCETEDLQIIAQAKAQATNTEIDFSTSMPFAESSFVLGDASLMKPSELKDFIETSVNNSNKSVVFFLPTAGSFGEVFSYLWEVLLELDMLDKGQNVEELIREIPTVSVVEEYAKDAGLKKVDSNTKKEIFEYENGEEFIKSPLIEFFFMPRWLEFLDNKEKEQVTKKLAQKIDSERNELSFQVSVKATLVSGEKS